MTRFRATKHRLAASTLSALLCVITASCRNTPDTDVPRLLERQTEQLMDAIASGDRDPWTRYLDEEIVYSAEDGSTKSKAQLIDEIRPFPKDIWGKLRVTEFRTARHGKTAMVGNRTGRTPEELKVELRDCLFVPGQSRLRKMFQRDAKGAVSGFVERRESWDIAWHRLPITPSD